MVKIATKGVNNILIMPISMTMNNAFKLESKIGNKNDDNKS